MTRPLMHIQALHLQLVWYMMPLGNFSVQLHRKQEVVHGFQAALPEVNYQELKLSPYCKIS